MCLVLGLLPWPVPAPFSSLRRYIGIYATARSIVSDQQLLVVIIIICPSQNVTVVLGSRELFSADILKNVKSNNTNITVHSRSIQPHTSSRHPPPKNRFKNILPVLGFIHKEWGSLKKKSPFVLHSRQSLSISLRSIVWRNAQSIVSI